MKTVCITSPIGFTWLEGNEKGLSKIWVSENGPVSEQIPEDLKEAVAQFQAYFEGTNTRFELTLTPEGTDFQKKVWNALLEIPYGKTCSYMDIAKRLGNPKSIRAVANANSKNPLWIIIPCHRVIGSDGSLTGYAGGLWRKKWLLAHENPNPTSLLF